MISGEAGSSNSPIPSGLADAAASGGRWGAIRSVGVQALTVLSTMVLARILTPEEFGLIAAATVVVSMFTLFTQFGFGTSLIRREKLDETEISTVYWTATFIGSLAALLAAVLAVPIAAIIGQPAVAPMIVVLGVLIPVGFAGSIGNALLIRSLRFRAAAAIELAGMIVYVALTIGLAWEGFGAWAVVWGQAGKTLFHVVGNLVSARWRPRFRFNRKAIKPELKFGGGLLGHSVLNYLNNNADYWAISAALGGEALGIYYVAYVIPNLVRRKFTGTAQEVLFPILSSLGQDLERLRSVYLKAMRFVGFLAIPALIGISVLADLVIEIAFGGQWEGAVGPLTILSISAAVMAVTIPGGWSLALAHGRPHLLLPSRALGLSVLVVGLVVTVRSGELYVVSWAVLASAVVTAGVEHAVTGRLVRVSPIRFIIEMVPVIIPTLIMVGMLLLTKSVVTSELSLISSAVALVAIGSTTYFFSSWVFFRSQLREQMRYLRSVARSSAG